MAPTFIDVQGFTGANNTFVVKEFAILKNKYELHHFIFKPPYPWSVLSGIDQRQALENKSCHGFNWNDGYIPYSELGNSVRPHFKTDTAFIVKNKSVQVILKKLFDLNTAYLGEPYTHSHQRRCAYHFAVCAMETVFSMRDALHL